MSRIIAIDTETTSLRFDRRAWEIGLIVRDGTRIVHPDRPDTYGAAEHHWFIDADDLDLGNADLMSLKIGRFFERHPQYRTDREYDYTQTSSEADALAEVEAITRGAHLVGAVVSFDAEVLGSRMRAHGICPSWHYHLIDCEALAVGHLSHTAAVCERRDPGELPGPEHGAELRALAAPPWKSDDLSAALGVEVSDDERHTALGDARWALRIFDAVMGRTA